MAESFLGPRTAGVDFIIGSGTNGVHYKTVATEQESAFDVSQDDVTVFNDEPDSAYEEGESTANFALAGRLKQGSVQSKPPLPASYQGSVITQIYGGSNTISGTANFQTLRIRRTVKNVGVFACAGRYVGPVVESWTTT